MRPPFLALLLAIVALVGASSLVLFLRPTDDGETYRLRVQGADLSSPWCNEGETVCVSEQSFEAGYALYTLDPHPHFRANGCRALWRPDFDLETVGSHGRGAFRSPCSGATFDRLGRLLFGPADRGLDQLAIEGEADDFEILLTDLQRGPQERTSR